MGPLYTRSPISALMELGTEWRPCLRSHAIVSFDCQRWELSRHMVPSFSSQYFGMSARKCTGCFKKPILVPLMTLPASLFSSMRVKFDLPTPYRMDATWDGKPLHCKWTDLSGRIGNRDSFSYSLYKCDLFKATVGNP